jgi:hypothetical protein
VGSASSINAARALAHRPNEAANLVQAAMRRGDGPIVGGAVRASYREVVRPKGAGCQRVLQLRLHLCQLVFIGFALEGGSPMTKVRSAE